MYVRFTANITLGYQQELLKPLEIASELNNNNNKMNWRFPIIFFWWHIRKFHAP